MWRCRNLFAKLSKEGKPENMADGGKHCCQFSCFIVESSGFNFAGKKFNLLDGAISSYLEIMFGTVIFYCQYQISQVHCKKIYLQILSNIFIDARQLEKCIFKEIMREFT